MIQNTESSGSTQPNKPISKKKGRMSFLINAAIFLVLLAVAIFGGYQSGIAIRQDTKSSAMLQKLGEQYQLALVDMQFGRYDNAKQRLEYIIQNDASFPGAQETLTQVLVSMNSQGTSAAVPTETPVATATPDFTGVAVADVFSKAQQSIAAQDWTGALAALDQARKLDSTYNTAQVDGMYYFALRNYGYDLITKQGNLEGGIYQLTLAERFGTLDSTANGLREGARYYILGASFWQLNWEQAVFYFGQINGGWPSLWDGTMTVAQRYATASMRYGDELYAKKQYCDAVKSYQNAGEANLDKEASSNYSSAYANCYPPTAEATATTEVIVVPTDPAATEAPTSYP